MENFDLMAKGFDTDSRTLRAKAMADKIRTHIENGSTKSAMEYGCGTGLVGLQLSNVFAKLLLVDASSEMLAQVKLKLEQLDNPSISTLFADFTKTMPQALHVDYIFSSLVFHHIHDTQGLLRSLYDSLHHAGHLLVIDLDSDDGSFHAKHPDFSGYHGFEHAALVDLAVKAGFQNVTIETFYHGSKSVKGEEKPYSLFMLDAMKPYTNA